MESKTDSGGDHNETRNNYKLRMTEIQISNAGSKTQKNQNQTKDHDMQCRSMYLIMYTVSSLKYMKYSPKNL